MDWQPLALGALGLLYAGLLWEVRQLRKAKHEHAQKITEALFKIHVIERQIEMMDGDER
jgi:hypothetical protein